jgi:hypothetical protein
MRAGVIAAIAHFSPLIWRHLNFLGRYDFSLPGTVMNGGLQAPQEAYFRMGLRINPPAPGASSRESSGGDG